MISVIGIPTDRHSSFLKGAALAPPLIIKEFHSDAGNKFAEKGLDLGKEGLWEDIGIIKLTHGYPPEVMLKIMKHLLIQSGEKLLKRLG